MTREEAAAVLGVDLDAGEAAVRRAFRSRARAAHPDSGGSSHDLNRLTEARDVLLSTPAEPVPTRPAPATPAKPAAARPMAPRPTKRGSVGRAVYAVVGAAIALAVVAVIAIVTVAIATGGDDEPPTDMAEPCLVVTDTGIEASSCSTPGAQRIVAEYSGARTCPPGSNTLVVGSTTWCLEPSTTD